MKKHISKICIGIVALAGYILYKNGSLFGMIVSFISLCVLISDLINWLNSTNRK